MKAVPSGRRPRWTTVLIYSSIPDKSLTTFLAGAEPALSAADDRSIT